MRVTQASENKLDALGFRRSIVNAYYRLYGRDMSFKILFRGRSLYDPAENLRCDGLNDWLVKD